MIIIESLGEDFISSSLTEIQGNTGKQGKVLDMVIQDLKVEVGTVKKTQM